MWNILSRTSSSPKWTRARWQQSWSKFITVPTRSSLYSKWSAVHTLRIWMTGHKFMYKLVDDWRMHVCFCKHCRRITIQVSMPDLYMASPTNDYANLPIAGFPPRDFALVGFWENHLDVRVDIMPRLFWSNMKTNKLFLINESIQFSCKFI